MKKTLKTLVLILCIILLVGCGGVKLDNGESAVVTFEEGGISAQELYNTLKETYGAENIVNMIDSYLLNKKYETTSEETNYIKQSVDSVKESASNYNTTFDAYVYAYYGVANESAFKKYVSLNYKRSLWIEEYGQEVVTDTQIKEYYETETVGDMTVSHILITPKATDDMTDEEKTKAKTEAYNTAKDVISKLQAGADFAELAKEYSEDEETSENGGSLGKINNDYTVTEVFESAKKLEVGSYTTTPLQSTYGYHIVYKTAQDEKPELDDDLKLKIRAVVGKEISSQQSFYLTAMSALREKNGMKFEDAELEKSYESYLNKLTLSTQQQ